MARSGVARPQHRRNPPPHLGAATWAYLKTGLGADLERAARERHLGRHAPGAPTLTTTCLEPSVRTFDEARLAMRAFVRALDHRVGLERSVYVVAPTKPGRRSRFHGHLIATTGWIPDAVLAEMRDVRGARLDADDDRAIKCQWARAPGEFRLANGRLMHVDALAPDLRARMAAITIDHLAYMAHNAVAAWAATPARCSPISTSPGFSPAGTLADFRRAVDLSALPALPPVPVEAWRPGGEAHRIIDEHFTARALPALEPVAPVVLEPRPDLDALLEPTVVAPAPAWRPDLDALLS